MKSDELRAFLSAKGVTFDEKEAPYAKRFECVGGEIFIAYSSGKVVAQGKKTDLTAAVEAIETPDHAPAPSKTVFVVYGHDSAALKELELILHRMGFDPVVLSNLASGGDTIIEKLEHYLKGEGKVGYACVLLTPDDEGYRFGCPAEKKPRARQNVVLELGMVLVRLGRSHVSILMKQGIEHPSDIGGMIYTPFTDSVSEVKGKLFQSLDAAGFKPNPKGLV